MISPNQTTLDFVNGNTLKWPPQAENQEILKKNLAKHQACEKKKKKLCKRSDQKP